MSLAKRRIRFREHENIQTASNL